jgi:hypothetical protein
MKATMLGILTFAHEHDKLPLTLAALPATDGKSLKTEDAWNRPLDYTFDAAGVVTLGSLGADKRPGGIGDNRDMVGTFNTRDSRGDWQKEFLQWKDDPLTE